MFIVDPDRIRPKVSDPYGSGSATLVSDPNRMLNICFTLWFSHVKNLFSFFLGLKVKKLFPFLHGYGSGSRFSCEQFDTNIEKQF